MAEAEVAQPSALGVGRRHRSGVAKGLLAATIVIGVLAPAATSWATPLMGC